MKIKILDRYILESHIAPYFFSLSVISFIFIMDFIIRWIGKFIANGVRPQVVLEFFVLSLGHMFALIIPMAVMPATLMAFGQFASENEITAMRSSGISIYRMMKPVVLATALLSIAMIFYNNFLLPESNHRLANLMMDIGRMKPTLEIKENIFSDAIDGYTILVREKNDRTGEIKGVQIFDRKAKPAKTIIAAGGRMNYNEREGVLRFELDDGEIHEMPDPTDIKTYRRTQFEHFELNLQDTNRGLKRSRRTYRSDREMSTSMMRSRIREYRASLLSMQYQMNEVALAHVITTLARVAPQAADLARGITVPQTQPPPVEQPIAMPRAPRESEQVLQMLTAKAHELDGVMDQIDRLEVEIHKKFAIPASCIVFILLGAPLAIRSGKRGMTMAVGFSIMFFLIYYIFLISGEKLADRGLVDPWLAMWAANIILSVVALFLTWSANLELHVFERLRHLNPAR